jgi:hypothetical protein
MARKPDPQEWRKTTYQLDPASRLGVERAARAVRGNNNAGARALLGAHDHPAASVRAAARELLKLLAWYASGEETK